MTFEVVGTDHRFQQRERGLQRLLESFFELQYFAGPIQMIAEEWDEQSGESLARRLATARGIDWLYMDMTTEEKIRAGIEEEQRDRRVSGQQLKLPSDDLREHAWADRLPMPIDPLTEICPSCKTGTLVSTDERSDGRAKHFSCGHKQYDIRLEDTLEFHASLGFKAKSQGKGKPYLEGRTGDDLHRKTGKRILLERVIDRARNWYKELITDPETSRVVRHCEEPLTNHRDHGIAKQKS